MSIKRVKGDWYNVPNILGYIRLILSPIPGILIVSHPHVDLFWWWATAVFIIAVLLDALDGFLARRLNQITELGMLIDPLADKILVVCTLGTLCGLNLWLAPVVVLFVGRELVIAWQIHRARPNEVIPAIWTGKVKMLCQGVMLIVLLIPLHSLVWLGIQLVITGIAIAWTLISWLSYYYEFVVKKPSEAPSP